MASPEPIPQVLARVARVASVGAAALSQQTEPERVADSDPGDEHEQSGADRRLPWERLLLPAIVLVQSTWMAFLVYLTHRALF